MSAVLAAAVVSFGGGAESCDLMEEEEEEEEARWTDWVQRNSDREAGSSLNIQMNGCPAVTVHRSLLSCLCCIISRTTTFHTTHLNIYCENMEVMKVSVIKRLQLVFYI